MLQELRRDSGEVLHAIPRYKQFLKSQVSEQKFAERIKACSLCEHRRGERCGDKAVQCVHFAKSAENLCRVWGDIEPPRTTVAPERPVPTYHQQQKPALGKKIENLAVVVCHFNPCGYKMPVRNGHEFLERLGVPVTVVELSFDGRFEFDAEHKIVGDLTKSFMWQKERLLNIGIQSQPSDVDAVAWIDMDAIFQNADWYEDTKQLLCEYPIVQLYEQIDYWGPDRSVIRQTPSWSHNWNTNQNGKIYGAPGLAWAARRDAIPWGIYDKDILGGGDCHSIAAFVKERKWIEKVYSSLSRPAADFDQWKARQYPLINGKIGCTPGVVSHLYHGSRENRQYGDRLQILIDHDFCINDIRVGENGVWEWASNKPRMHRAIREYFLNREEDS